MLTAAACAETGIGNGNGKAQLVLARWKGNKTSGWGWEVVGNFDGEHRELRSDQREEVPCSDESKDVESMVGNTAAFTQDYSTPSFAKTRDIPAPLPRAPHSALRPHGARDVRLNSPGIQHSRSNACCTHLVVQIEIRAAICRPRYKPSFGPRQASKRSHKVLGPWQESSIWFI